MTKWRVVVAGTRDVPLDAARDALRTAFASKMLQPYDIEAIATGESGVVDRLGRKWAEYHAVDYRPFPADWSAHGKAAGPMRNEQMARWAAEGAGLLVAVWNGKSRGTADMILNAHRYGLEVEVRIISEPELGSRRE